MTLPALPEKHLDAMRRFLEEKPTEGSFDHQNWREKVRRYASTLKPAQAYKFLVLLGEA